MPPVSATASGSVSDSANTGFLFRKPFPNPVIAAALPAIHAENAPCSPFLPAAGAAESEAAILLPYPPTPPAPILCRRRSICFCLSKSPSIYLFCLPVPIGMDSAENTDRCQPPKRQSQRRTKRHRCPFPFQTAPSKSGCSVLP